MAHQAVLPMRYTPHPNKVVQTRWPTPGWQRSVIDPTDHRRHSYEFSYRQLRFKPLSKDPQEVPEMSLDEIRNYLVMRFGSLQQAFHAMDFFKDGQVSLIEWQEGIYNTLESTFGDNSHKFRPAIVPRKHFNARMKQLFALIDEDKDGLINFDEFSRPFLDMPDSSHSFTRRRQLEKATHSEEKQVNLARTMLSGSLTAHKKGPPAHHQEMEDESEPTPLRDFAVFIMKTFKDVNSAFDAFDVAQNRSLNMVEFVEGARRIGYEGNAEELFRLLDPQEAGTLAPRDFKALRQLPEFSGPAPKPFGLQTLSTLSLGTSKKDAFIERRLRQNLKDPAAHESGLTLSGTDISRPFGASMRSASNFYTFPRSRTGRMDNLLHMNQIPGEDAEQFSAEHGPGYLDSGPESFPYLGQTCHPRRGDKWKMGATINKTERFGQMVPSRQGKEEMNLSGMSFLSHEGRIPSDGAHYKMCNTGAVSWGRSPVRPGITHKS